MIHHQISPYLHNSEKSCACQCQPHKFSIRKRYQTKGCNQQGKKGGIFVNVVAVTPIVQIFPVQHPGGCPVSYLEVVHLVEGVLEKKGKKYYQKDNENYLRVVYLHQLRLFGSEGPAIIYEVV